MVVLANRKNENEVAKVIDVDDVRKTQELEFITGDRAGKVVTFSNSTLKRWWKKVAVPDDVLGEPEKKDTPKKAKAQKKDAPKKARKQSGKTDEWCKDFIDAIEKEGYEVKAYPSLKRCYSIKIEGGKHNIACMDIRRKYVKVYKKTYTGEVETFDYDMKDDELIDCVVGHLDALATDQA